MLSDRLQKICRVLSAGDAHSSSVHAGVASLMSGGGGDEIHLELEPDADEAADDVAEAVVSPGGKGDGESSVDSEVAEQWKSPPNLCLRR